MKTTEPPPNSPKEFREKLRLRLGLDDLPADLLTYLREEALEHAAIGPPPTWSGFNDCVRESRTWMTDHSELFRCSRRARKELSQKRVLRGHELARAQFQTRRVAAMAIEEPSVTRVRKRLFGRKLLTSEEAVRMFRSMAVGLLPELYFSANSIPLGGHDSRISLADGTMPISWGPEVLLRIEVGQRTVDYPYQEFWHNGNRHYDNNTRLTHLAGCTHKGNAHPGSVLDELRVVSEGLSSSYPWDSGESLWFVVTGEIPDVDPATSRMKAWYGTRGTFATVTMEIEPWLSPETVKQVYREVQKKHFKRARRGPSAGKLKMYEFVNNRLESLGGADWPRLFAEAKKASRAAGCSDSKSFGRAYRRTAAWIDDEFYFPQYKLLGRDSSSGPKPRRRARSLKP